MQLFVQEQEEKHNKCDLNQLLEEHLDLDLPDMHFELNHSRNYTYVCNVNKYFERKCIWISRYQPHDSQVAQAGVHLFNKM